MIKIKVCYENDFIKSFKVTGHANYDSYGKDIVCASVSSIVITSCNLALKYNDKDVKFEQKEGLIEAEIKVEDKFINIIFTNMIDMLKELEKQYKNNVKII